jgi:hypothetical protein
MAKRVPGMFLVAAGCLAVAVALGYGAARAFAQGTPGFRLLGYALGLGAFFAFLLAIACVVFGFGVDFR